MGTLVAARLKSPMTTHAGLLRNMSATACNCCIWADAPRLKCRQATRRIGPRGSGHSTSTIRQPVQNPPRQFHVTDKMQGPAAEHRIAMAGNAGDDAVFLNHDMGMARQGGDRFDLRAIARAPAAQIDFL
jgi:hypothetical protein